MSICDDNNNYDDNFPGEKICGKIFNFFVFLGSWGKRDPAWHNLKGLWGKRSVDSKWAKLQGGWGKRSTGGGNIIIII